MTPESGVSKIFPAASALEVGGSRVGLGNCDKASGN